jgi:hypothetical protein
MSKLRSLERDKDLYEYKKNIMIVNTMKGNHMLLDLITSKSYPYYNMFLSKQEFYDLLNFIKSNCFIIKERKKEDNWEYDYEIEFLYNSRPLLLKNWKSYTSQEEIFVLRREV